jgi:hypothetical protein
MHIGHTVNAVVVSTPTPTPTPVNLPCGRDTYIHGTLYANRSGANCTFPSPSSMTAQNSSPTPQVRNADGSISQLSTEGYICARDPVTTTGVCSCPDGSFVGFNQRLNCDEHQVMVSGATLSPTALDGTPIPTPYSHSKAGPNAVRSPAIALPAHAGDNGGGPGVQAYSVSTVPCSGKATPPISKLWTHNFDFESYGAALLDMFGIKANEAISYKFTVPMEDSQGSVSILDGNGFAGTPTTPFLSISKQPCDFDISKAWGMVQEGPNAAKKVANSCYQPNSGPGVTISWYNSYDKNTAYASCPLERGGTYYLNYRALVLRSASVAEDGCHPNGGDSCGGLMQFSGWQGVR